MHAFRRRSALAVAAAAALASIAAAPSAATEPAFAPGTYAQINPGTKKPADPGNQLVVVRGKNGRLAFSLNAVRGTDVNQGYVAGTLPPASGASLIWVQQAEGANCKLTFTAAAGAIVVVQDSKFGDCGFGEGVSADGQYVRRP